MIPPGYWDSKPGDMFALDADVTLYWPRVRPCWEEPPTPSRGDETTLGVGRGGEG